MELIATALPALGDALALIFRPEQMMFLVLGSKRGPQPMKVLLDGKPISAQHAGKDVKNGVAMIDEQRLYTLVDMPNVQEHRLTLQPANGIAGYAFTFG